MAAHLAQTLRAMVDDGGVTTDQLRAWRLQALEKLAENSGQTINNASAHGISFTAAGRLTWDVWLSVLSIVLRSIERNVKPAPRAAARF